MIAIASVAAAAARPIFAQAVQCPETIRVSQQIAEVPAGWIAGASDLPIQATGVTFFDGPPEQMASLVYDSYRTTKQEARGLWTFKANSPGGIWISCGYAQTIVTLAQRLPGSTTRCEVVYDRGSMIGGFNPVKHIDCK
jgi:hypothetical protein